MIHLPFDQRLFHHPLREPHIRFHFLQHFFIDMHSRNILRYGTEVCVA